jgi:coiled-coil domain-containing protein 12
LVLISDENAEIVLNTRNFDPETRTLRKRTQADAELEDTLEKDVEGLAERIIVEDEERRAQDLVRCFLCYFITL